MTLGERVLKIRSKNAGPFWVTVDVFCGEQHTFEQLSVQLTTATVARLYRQPEHTMKRFDLERLNVIKFSFPRPVVQGSRFDRDMHGAQWAELLAELELPESAR